MGFIPGAIMRVLDAVASILSSRNGSGKTTEENTEAMGDVERGDEPSDCCQQLLRGYVSKGLKLLLDLLSYPQRRTHIALYLSSRHPVVPLALSVLYHRRSFVLV